MDVLLIVLGVVLLLIIIVVGWMISTTNTFRRKLVKIDESESSIDVALTKRFDLLTKLVGAVKGATKHERETLTEVVAMRQPSRGASIQEKQEFAEKVTRGLNEISVVVEQYPQLRANENFLNLQNATSEVEENLQAARRVYNANVSIYNQKVVTFPSSLIAGWKNFTKREFFEAEASKREDVKFDF